MAWSDYEVNTFSQKGHSMTGLIYLMAPYTNVVDKKRLMTVLYSVALDYMTLHPGAVVVSPLFYHFATELVPGTAGDWNAWEAYSIGLLRRCDGTIMVRADGWENSTGLRSETQLAFDLAIPVVAVYDNDGNQMR